MMYAKLILIPILLIGICSGDELLDLLTSIFENSENSEPLKTVNGSQFNNPCGDGMECVREYLCSGGKVNKDGVTVINIRAEEKQSCPFLETCCAIADKVVEPIDRPDDPPMECGVRNEEGVGFKIVGARDNEAEFGEFPWMLAILRKKRFGNKIYNSYQCGGSLIKPDVVLTGAYYVYGQQAEDFIVRAGEWETNIKTEIFAEQDLQVVKIIVHEDYNNKTLYNNIALLFLDAPFDLAPNVNTVCLPPASENFDLSRCFVTGWGKDQFENGKYRNILKKIDVPVVPNAKCQENLRSTRLGEFFELHSSFMCAGGEGGKGICKGDGGSPLVCPMKTNPDRYFQAGIAAWIIGCGEENIPGVYISVTKFLPWIDDKLAIKLIDEVFFTP